MNDIAAKDKLSIIVPTKDRPFELNRLLESVYRQETRPAQVIIVDGGGDPVEGVIRIFPNLNIDYIRMTPPSLTAQRNAGIRALRPDITIAAFLDDDIVLKPESLKNMMKFWEGAPPDTGGASFNLVNEIYKKPTLIERFFLVNTSAPNKVLRSGFQGKISFVDRDIPAQWLVGCAMVFRKKVFEEFMFDEWYSSYARYEDVDFSYRVGKRYKMFVVAEARVEHLNKSEDIEFSFALGKMEVINRLHFVRKNPDLSVTLCYWALCGILVNHIIKGVLHSDRRCLRRAAGNISGILHDFAGRRLT